ncbi:hypothetical protein [Halalkalibacter krulwichiae]|uniref:Uncharacterized protein n=1 Tax=Halalkalibacter krulwichiae TaxID=199441 RepID=A0A1X9MBK3_9BACI|nr:hypothetical protein [Halalkalibacter krulwichiae]ARK30796.1 hypothetical protein BkAM31D_13650 [Halalkalibacter krulwichiae]
MKNKYEQLKKLERNVNILNDMLNLSKAELKIIDDFHDEKVMSKEDLKKTCETIVDVKERLRKKLV